MLPSFRIRNLRRPGSPPNRQLSVAVPKLSKSRDAVIRMSGAEYDSTIRDRPEATLKYFDDDDGEIVTVGITDVVVHGDTYLSTA